MAAPNPILNNPQSVDALRNNPRLGQIIVDTSTASTVPNLEANLTAKFSDPSRTWSILVFLVTYYDGTNHVAVYGYVEDQVANDNNIP